MQNHLIFFNQSKLALRRQSNKYQMISKSTSKDFACMFNAWLCIYTVSITFDCLYTTMQDTVILSQTENVTYRRLRPALVNQS